MKIGIGQLVCLILGVFFVSLGGGMLGGRLFGERSGAVVIQRPTGAGEDGNTAATKDPRPPKATAETERGPEKDVTPTEAEAESGESTATAGVVLPESSKNTLAPVAQPAEKPTAPKEETVATAGKRSPESRLKHVIQATSTANQADARAARKRIMAEGFPAAIFEANLPGRGTYFRVYVGPYETETEAQRALAVVRDIPGFSESFLKELK